MKTLGKLLLCLMLLPWIARAQQPQTQNLPPITPPFDVNANYVNGWAPGYWATAGSGLSLSIGPGTVPCAGVITNYAGGSLTMTNSATNYVYLNTGASCVPASSTSSSVFSTNPPIAIVVASGGAITAITDVRTMFGATSGGGGGGSGTVGNCSAQYSLAEYLVSGTAVGCGPTPPATNGDYLCGYTVTGSAALAPTCPQVGLPPRGVTGTTDTILYSDVGIPVVYRGTAAVAVTLPTPTTLGNTAFWTVIDNFTSGPGGNVTVTPTTLTISKDNGGTGSSLVIAANQECRIETDPANPTTNWLSHCDSTATGSVTSVGTSSPLSGGPIVSTGTISCPTCLTSAAGGSNIRDFGTTFGDTGGSALTSGSVVYFTVPYACTINAWNIAVDAGTVTFDIWKIATGTAIPTVSNSITASAKPALSTGTALHSTTLTGWTTSVSANDIFGIQLNTVATAKYAEIDIQCGQ